MEVDPHLQEPGDAHEAVLARMRRRRDAGTWYAVTGVAMLFGGSIHVGFAIGGVFMVLGGATAYLYWGYRLTKAEDPWDDEDIDAWERDHFG